MSVNEAQIICQALLDGTLSEPDLTARKIGSFLGKTTSVLYHNYGSLDNFLYAVSREGLALFTVQVGAHDRPLVEVGLAYVDYALDHPVLYGLMFHRQWDWPTLSCPDGPTPGLLLWRGLVHRFEAAGSACPDADARVFFGALHGLSSLAVTGRANIDRLQESDRQSAHRAVLHLCHRLESS